VETLPVSPAHHVGNLAFGSRRFGASRHRLPPVGFGELFCIRNVHQKAQSFQGSGFDADILIFATLHFEHVVRLATMKRLKAQTLSRVTIHQRGLFWFV
jgi:hypothetical protein